MGEIKNTPKIKAINRQTSIQTLGIVLTANILLALIYYKTLYVRQANIDVSVMDSLQAGQGDGVCMEGQ
jgi:hypothetical protein